MLMLIGLMYVIIIPFPGCTGTIWGMRKTPGGTNNGAYGMAAAVVGGGLAGRDLLSVLGGDDWADLEVLSVRLLLVELSSVAVSVGTTEPSAELTCV